LTRRKNTKIYKDMKKIIDNSVSVIISTVFLLLALVSCRTHKSVEGQVLNTSTDSTSIHKIDSISRELRITVKDSTEVRDSIATEYIIGKFDSAAGVRVDTLKQSRWHYEKKATDREKEGNKAVATINEKSREQTLTAEEETEQSSGSWKWAVIVLLVLVTIIAYTYKKFFNKSK